MNDVIQGKGVKVLADGTKYIGKWKNGIFSEGKKILSNGEEIEGKFERNGTIVRKITKKNFK